MAPKRKTRRAAAAEEAAAHVEEYPDEQQEGAQPPLPDEQPPLPTDAPPLPTDSPPLPTEQPPLPMEQPPLPTEQPPLPTENPPLPDEPLPAAEPVTELGGDDDDEDEDEDEDEEEEKEGADSKGKGKGKGADADQWQAVWSPEKNAYYFWNTESGEVTWTNPLAPADSSSTPATASSSAPPLPAEPAPVHRPTTIAGPSGLPAIDPALAYLVPAEQRGSVGGLDAAMAFAARSGRHGVDTGYGFAHLDEYNRAKRFSEHYFDVEGYEKQRAAEAAKRKRDEEAGVGQGRKITKKDMDRFRQKKQEHKQRRNQWLYD